MKNKKLLTVIFILALVLSFAACAGSGDDEGKGGKNGKDASSDGALVFFNEKYDHNELGEPDKELDPEKIYASIEYNEKMFQGSYKLPGGEEAEKKYCKEMDSIPSDAGYATNITAIPYKVEFGRDNITTAISKVDGYNWARTYFYNTDAETLDCFMCAYEVKGKQVIFTPVKASEVDKDTNKVSFQFSDMKLVYDFSFKGRELTLSSNGKSVTMKSGLMASSDDIHVSVAHYLSKGSPAIDNIVQFSFSYSEATGEKDISFYLSFDKTYDGENKYPIGKMTDDGLFTFTYTLPGGKPITHQYVYFYCDNEGLILADEQNVYYYCDSNSEYYGRDLKKYTGEEVDFSELSESQINQIIEKKDNLLGDLVDAFAKQGITVSVNNETGELAMDSSILFGGDSAELTAEGKDFLKKFIAAYSSIVYSDEYSGFISKTMVEGYTAPTKDKTYEDDLPLSEARAKAVRDFCISEESGIAKDKIDTLSSSMEAVGKSNSVPVLDADGNVDMSASRRVSFRFIINIESVK